LPAGIAFRDGVIGRLDLVANRALELRDAFRAFDSLIDTEGADHPATAKAELAMRVALSELTLALRAAGWE
jgi:hypothetical protein